MSSLEIFAILSKSQYQKVVTGECSISVPNGVQLSNKAGSRNLYFSCDDGDSVKELIDGLDESGISWQEVYALKEYEQA